MKTFCLREISDDIIHCLTEALDAKDPYTSGHSHRVGEMSYDLAVAMGLPPFECQLIHIAGHVHDIGKIGIPDSILHKDGPLNDEEWAVIQKHPQIGHGILSKCERLSEIARIILHHHERFDGKGYPLGLSGQNITIGGRIIAVCDTIDAMTSCRPYRSAYSWQASYQEVIKNAGTQFDPDVVNAMIPLFPKWEQRFHGEGEKKPSSHIA